MKNGNLIRKTISLCPICRAKIPATGVEDAGQVFMEKSCPVHGPFRNRIAKYPRYYRELMAFLFLLKRHYPWGRNRAENYAFTSTFSCNLACPVCFAGDAGRTTPPPESLADLEAMLRPIRGRGLHIKITGGEPTTRDDLPEIIRLVRASGNYPVVTTNGIRMGDFEYLKSLKKCGLSAIAPWFDSGTRDEVFERMRGRKMLAQRQMLLRNIDRLGLKFIAFFTCVKGVNEDGLREVLALPRAHPNLFRIAVEGYMHRGTRGFSEANTFTVDELWEAVADATAFSLDELVTLMKVSLVSRVLRGVHRCYNTQFILMPRSGRRADGFDPARWREVLDRFQDLLAQDPRRARSYFTRTYAAELIRKGFLPPLFRRFVLRETGLPECFIPSRFYWLAFQVLYYPDNYDEEMVRGFCPNLALNPGPEKLISFCEYCNLELRT
jgi:organic radical activating enzyme